MKFSPERKRFIGFSLIIPFYKAPEIFSFRNHQRPADTFKTILNTTKNLDPSRYVGRRSGIKNLAKPFFNSELLWGEKPMFLR
ncbi:MAG TPA: hypothetical protein VNB90_02100 [Cytophagaceae bacterium]|nr:hypothetical protein [Cytophagaceae bacterium]